MKVYASTQSVGHLANDSDLHHSKVFLEEYLQHTRAGTEGGLKQSVPAEAS